MYSRLGDTRLPLPPLLLFAGLVATGACLAGGNHLDTLFPRRCPCARSGVFFLYEDAKSPLAVAECDTESSAVLQVSGRSGQGNSSCHRTSNGAVSPMSFECGNECVGVGVRPLVVSPRSMVKNYTQHTHSHYLVPHAAGESSSRASRSQPFSSKATKTCEVDKECFLFLLPFCSCQPGTVIWQATRSKQARSAVPAPRRRN